MRPKIPPGHVCTSPAQFFCSLVTELLLKPKLFEKKGLDRLNMRWNWGQNWGQNFAFAYFLFKGCVVCSTSSLWRSDPRHTKAFIKAFNRLSKGGNRPADAFYVSQMSLNKKHFTKSLSFDKFSERINIFTLFRDSLCILLFCWVVIFHF